jgi:hypothetical protein
MAGLSKTSCALVVFIRVTTPPEASEHAAYHTGALSAGGCIAEYHTGLGNYKFWWGMSPPGRNAILSSTSSTLGEFAMSALQVCYL